MDDINNIDNFEELLESSLNRTDNFTIGDRVTGTVVALDSETVFVDISGKSEAIIDTAEFRDSAGTVSIRNGDTIEAYVISTGGGEIRLTANIGKGTVSLGILGTAYDNGIPVYGTVQRVVKGGFRVNISGINGFCPFSQIDQRPSDNHDQYMNKSFLFKIIEFSEKDKNIILSRRAMLDDERQRREDDLKHTLQVGDTLQGIITAVKNFGIFVDIGGYEAFIPRSEISWSRIVDMDNYQPGQEITASVKGINWDEKGITLSVKDLSPEPWDNIDKYSPGQDITGRVINIIKNGAFVEIEPGLDGFVHVSRMSFIKKVSKPEEIVALGDQVKVKIIDVMPGERKISLELLTDESDPWLNEDDEMINKIVSGTVETIKPAGLNLRLDNGMLGFVPRGELNCDSNTDIKKKYPPGSGIKATVIKYSRENKKLVLSETRVMKAEEKQEFEKYMKAEQSSQNTTLGSLLRNQFDKIQNKIDKNDNK